MNGSVCVVIVPSEEIGVSAMPFFPLAGARGRCGERKPVWRSLLNYFPRPGRCSSSGHGGLTVEIWGNQAKRGVYKLMSCVRTA